MGKRFEVEVQGKMFEVDLAEGESIEDVVAEIEASQGVTSAPASEPDLGEAIGGSGGIKTFLSGAAQLPIGIADLITPNTAVSFEGGKLSREPVTQPSETETVKSLVESLGLQGPDEPRNLGESLLFGAGETVLPGAAFGRALAIKGPKLAEVIAREATGPVKRFFARAGQKVGESFQKAPIQFTALETIPGGGARAGLDIAKEEGLSPLAQAGVGVTAGLATGAAPAVAVNLARRVGAGVINTLLAPFTKGGTARAARTTQARTAGPIQDVVDDTGAVVDKGILTKIDEAPPGVTPAQASEDPGLLSQQAKALEDNPVLAKQIEDELLEARIKAQDDLKATFGEGTTPGDFQHAVVQSVAPPNATIAQGQTDEMVKAAFDGYKVAYRAFDGHPIDIGQFGFGDTLSDVISQAALKKNIGVTVLDTERKAMFDLLTDMAETVERGGRAVKGQPIDRVSSQAILRLRRRIRKSFRRRSRAPGERAEAETAMLKEAETRLTTILEDSLPPDVASALRATDSQYAKLIVVENAANRGNGEFTVQQLQTALRANVSPGRIARGEAGDLATFAQQGTDLKRVLGKPRDAARVVRNMTSEQVQATKGDFAKVMFDAPGVKTTVGAQVGISGKGLLKFLGQQKETMAALGFTADDFTRADQMGRLLRMMETRSPKAANDLLEDGPGRILDLMSRIVGSLSLTKAVRNITGSGSGGAGIIIAKAGSENMRAIVRSLTFDKAAMLMREAVTDRELFKALLTSATDPIITQIQAGRRINAFFLSVGVDTINEAQQTEDE